MMKLALSAAAAGLLRALLARAGVSRDRILLTEFRSVDWNSLTFSGERHEIDFRVSRCRPRFRVAFGRPRGGGIRHPRPHRRGHFHPAKAQKESRRFDQRSDRSADDRRVTIMPGEATGEARPVPGGAHRSRPPGRASEAAPTGQDAARCD